MSNQNLSDIPQPDPAWDYYITWHKLYRAKHRLDKLLNYLAGIEQTNIDTDEEIEADVVKIISQLQELMPKI
ncbi:MAG: hypothetical protein RMX59_033260 [Nostoc sp. DedSLP05]|nr:hypothetical protein [Nostoc sp. DedSLP05]MDZ8100734.1 hypothetical protein [Nostoc sp. DedSLP01]